jgi:hypothetical protein
MTRLSDAQRRILFELVILGETPLQSKVKKELREPLAEAGLVQLQKNPRGRGKIVVATEKGWAWVVDHVDEPFTHGSLNPRRLWNHLTARLARFLEARGENLASVLNDELADEEVPPASAGAAPPGREGADAADPDADLRAAYLRLSGGELRRRVSLTPLRAAAGLPREVFDAALARLHEAGAVVLFPEDERSRLDAQDHAAAISVSGVPQHVIYWER